MNIKLTHRKDKAKTKKEKTVKKSRGSSRSQANFIAHDPTGVINNGVRQLKNYYQKSNSFWRQIIDWLCYRMADVEAVDWKNE